jgi:DNA-binding transcriptional LysR family regulator
VVSSIVRLLRLASFLVCVILITSFVFFAVDQTKSASVRQRESLGPALASASASPEVLAPAPHRSHVRRMIDNASSALTSPFSGIVSPSDGEWAVRSADLLIALALYGFGLGYLARVLRISL